MFRNFLPRIRCLVAHWGLKFSHPERVADGQTELSFLPDKPFFSLEVESAEGARPEVQATTIEFRVPPRRNGSQCCLIRRSD